MRLGGFQIVEPVPELNAPHVLAVLSPWIDAGDAGTLAISRYETSFGAAELGRLIRPGNFFDFTRYRPTMYWREGVRVVTIPNTVVNYARREAANDFIFIHLLEPHMFGEIYTDSVLKLLKKLEVKRYILLGSMYDLVPHTRRLLVTGSAVGGKAAADLERAEVFPSDYEGPSTICHLIPQQAAQLGIETMTLIAHLPQYTEIEEDYTGQVRLLEVLGSLYDIPVDATDIKRAEEQARDITIAVNSNRKIKEVVEQLEINYDARSASRQKEEMPPLSPQIENFLKEMEKRFRQQG